MATQETQTTTKNLGGSLPVDNVQNLASNNPKDLPSRYIRPELQFDPVSTDDSLQIPVVDMTKLGDEDENEMTLLHKACQHWGFFQLINHGIEEQVIENMKKDIQEFFKLPLEKKMACAQLPNDIQGYGQAFVVSEHQKLDWADMLFLLPQPLSQRDFRFWPKHPISFRETLENYSAELKKVSVRLVRVMGRNLQVDSEKLGAMFEDDGIQGVRMNYYPPCPQAEKVIGLTPHSDAVGLTLLLQVNDVQGLQVKKNGEWIPIKPIRGALIINVGDVIEIMSNGEYKSIEHRAVVNPENERLSIAGFHSPNMNTMIGPLQDLINDKKPIYKTIQNVEYIKLILASKLDGKSLLSRMKLD
ncbi:2-oxoglutarate (2OG) and Fe(II)-dependent oxygenase superfamily protein [Euphorbia peplus]|nr:2-oxoglutarate (2OG) and Fe(II)-dependent oxygenase superfamily protein [Euphorbia peplus]